MQALVDANHRNHETWRPLLPLFDPAVSGAAEDDTLLHPRPQRAAARSWRRRPRASIDWDGTTFHDEAESLRLFYADPERSSGAGERSRSRRREREGSRAASCSPAASGTGPTTAAASSPQILTRISRAYAYTRWKHDYSHQHHGRGGATSGGMAERSGYTQGRLGRGCSARRAPDGDIRCALVWMDAERAARRHRRAS